MAVTFTNLTSGGDTDGNGTAVTASISPAANSLCLALVKSRMASSTNPNQPTITGNGITWTAIASLVTDSAGASRQRMTLFRGSNASPTSGAATISFSAQNQTHVGWIIDQASGVDTATNDGVVQAGSALINSGGPAGTILTATLGAVTAGNSTYGAFGNGNTTITPVIGSGYATVKLFQETTGNSMTLFTESQTGTDNTVDVTFSSDSEVGLIAVEVKGLASSNNTRIGNIVMMGVGN